MTAVLESAQPEVISGRTRVRYGVVFLLLLVLLLFEVVTPSSSVSHAIDVALGASALTWAVATSRARRTVRRVRTRAVAGAAFVVVIGVATGLFPAAFAWAVLTVILAAIPVTIGGALLRLIRDEGVTVQAVAGALAVYLVVGLLFASVIAFAAKVGSSPYFMQGSGVTNGDVTYYSFTVLTTTGFGDYTAATSFGHALAVLEMLTGQLYLVTVIGILVGNFRSNRTEA